MWYRAAPICFSSSAGSAEPAPLPSSSRATRMSEMGSSFRSRLPTLPALHRLRRRRFFSPIEWMKGRNGFCARMRFATSTGTSGSMPRIHARGPIWARAPASSGLCMSHADHRPAPRLVRQPSGVRMPRSGPVPGIRASGGGSIRLPKVAAFAKWRAVLRAAGWARGVRRRAYASSCEQIAAVANLFYQIGRQGLNRKPRRPI